MQRPRRIGNAGFLLEFDTGSIERSTASRPVLTGWALRPLSLYAVFPSSRHLAPKVRVCVDYLVGYFGESPAWDTGLSD